MTMVSHTGYYRESMWRVLLEYLFKILTHYSIGPVDEFYNNNLIWNDTEGSPNVINLTQLGTITVQYGVNDVYQQL